MALIPQCWRRKYEKRKDIHHLRPLGGGKGNRGGPASGQRSHAVLLCFRHDPGTAKPGELDGVHYHFLSREQFQQWIAEDAFLEHAEFVGNYYGTPKKYVDAAMEQGRDVLLDIEIQGAEQVHRQRPEVVRIYVAPPSWAELERRLIGRGTEDMEKVRSRLERGKQEFAAASSFDYFVINDTVDNAVTEIRAIMLAEHCRPDERVEMIDRG